MIGLNQRPRGLFGNPMDRYRPPYATPGIGDGMNEPNPMMSAVRAPSPQQQPEPRQPRRMDEKLYALGGLLANIGGIPNNAMGEYMAGLRNREQAALQAQAEQMADARRRALDRADKQWEWDNKPDTYRWRSNSGDLMEIGPDGQPRVAYNDPTDKIQWVRAENGDGTFTMVPVGANGPVGGGSGPLPEFTEEDWNNAGGGTGNGVGGF